MTAVRSMNKTAPDNHLDLTASTPKEGEDLTFDTTRSLTKKGCPRIPSRQSQLNRLEKSMDQTLVLENEFKKSAKWSKEKMAQLAKLLCLTES